MEQPEDAGDVQAIGSALVEGGYTQAQLVSVDVQCHPPAELNCWTSPNCYV